MVGISLSDETKVIELVGEPRNTTKTVPAYKEQILATRRVKGVVNPFRVTMPEIVKWT